MIQEFVDTFISRGDEIKLRLAREQPREYGGLIKLVVEIIAVEEYGYPDPDRIVEIDHGDYQGTLVYVIGAGGHQPSKYWAVKVEYGSCSWCDTLEKIKGYSEEPPTDEQVNDYYTLCLHIVQGLKEV